MEQQPYNRIGVTENGDPCFDFSWVKNLQSTNLIITKELNEKMIDNLIAHRDKIILHLTCTGLGGTEMEPYVPTPEKLKVQFNSLLQRGFPIKQVVLRIDPIILNFDYYKYAFKPIKLFKNNILRLRFSFLNRFSSKGKKFIFKQDISIFKFLDQFIKKTKKYYILESCSGIKNPFVNHTSCFSQKEAEILNKKILFTHNNRKRKFCTIPSNTIELLNKNNCVHGCIYCYLKK